MHLISTISGPVLLSLFTGGTLNLVYTLAVRWCPKAVTGLPWLRWVQNVLEAIRTMQRLLFPWGLDLQGRALEIHSDWFQAFFGLKLKKDRFVFLHSFYQYLLGNYYRSAYEVCQWPIPCSTRLSRHNAYSQGAFSLGDIHLQLCKSRKSPIWEELELAICSEADSRARALRMHLLSKLSRYLDLRCILHGVVLEQWPEMWGKKWSTCLSLGVTTGQLPWSQSTTFPLPVLGPPREPGRGRGTQAGSQVDAKCVFGAPSRQSGRNLHCVRCSQVGRPARPLPEMRMTSYSPSWNLDFLICNQG